MKEGKGRKDGQPMPGEDEDLHALISAPTEQGLHNAIKKVCDFILRLSLKLCNSMPHLLNSYQKKYAI